MMEKLETAFISIVKKLWDLPESEKNSMGEDILNNLEFEVQKLEFLEQSNILKSKLKVLFELDDRYCATGDEKYYLDLPGREGEKLLPSEVRKFLRDCEGDQLTKTLQSRYEKFKNEENCDNIKSFNAKLKACVNNLSEKVKKCEKEKGQKRKRRITDEDDRSRTRERGDSERNKRERSIRERSTREKSGRRSRSKSSRNRPSQNRRRTRSRSFSRRINTVSKSPRRNMRSRSPRRRSRSRDQGGRSRLSADMHSQQKSIPFAPFTNMNNMNNMNNQIANSEIISAASNIIGKISNNLE